MSRPPTDLVATNKPSFFAELKRRNVLRAAVLYAGGVWALSQGVSQLSPALGLPDVTTRWFLVACLIGFPFWLAFAWFYEFTPQGFKREDEVVVDAPQRHSNARKLDFAIIGVLIMAVALLAAGYFVRRRAVAVEPATNSSPFNPPRGSLVVLPFKNLSGDPKQQFFSDGITEELTDALGQNPGLRVIAWETASTLRHLGLTPNALGRRLDVANILNGSILRAGNDVRITAELVDARNGVQLWSHHYDGSFADVFKMQDEVSESIASALKVRFAQADLPAMGTHNTKAHELVLRGRAFVKSQRVADVEAARKDFEAAIVLDPDYADAHAMLSRALIALSGLTNLPLQSVMPQVRAEAEKAVALDPRSSDAWVALAISFAYATPPSMDEARAAFRKALALDPSNAGAHLDYGSVLPLKAALAEEMEATRLDPANATAWNNVAAFAQDLSSWPEMISALETLIKLDPQDIDAAFSLAFAYRNLREYGKMVAAFDLVKPASAVDQEQIDAGRLVYRALREPTLRAKALAAVKALARHRTNPDVAGNLTQLNLVLGENAAALSLIESSCKASPVGCGDLAINPVYQPLRADPAFEALARKYTTTSLE